MPASLTTHVLDTATGRPAQGIAITLFRLTDKAREQVATARTNADGRTDAPILPEAPSGQYELIFHAGDYLRGLGQDADPLFLSEIPVRFGISEERHYHVPLLLSPYGYSTYRGS
ncbi:hydroxyisourate hydrolase [Salipiger sp. IMCC34102]|uniref:hydroxyisourate hydrolase n=1 Tax=Salipiger sp. IMCC34102 TaxID=2510647 RepID=UPI00101BC919|nr:hydroxyisourate hydrolase [Salipiger sp. IMCC34102]RYH04584.1 hydroxyisourate hydrolase [Salipiger sp. IMCC34102]